MAASFRIKVVIKLLLEKEADTVAADSDGRTPLHWASQNGYVEVVELLLSKGANVNAQEPYGTALQAASAIGHDKTVELLLSTGAV